MISRMGYVPVPRFQRLIGEIVFCLCCAVCLGANAQTEPATGATPAENPGDSPLKFEVATIKPVDRHSRFEIAAHVYPEGRLVMTGQSLKGLIMAAFDLRNWQIVGDESWVKENLYDIQAVVGTNLPGHRFVPENTWLTISDKDMKLMLQSLLQDRFNLKFHRASKDGTTFDLEKSGKPIKLRTHRSTAEGSDYSGEIGRVSGRGFTFSNLSMAQLANHLSDFVLRVPVTDHTGLDGTYDFESSVIQTDSDFKDPSRFGDSFLDAVKESGLKLTKTHGPVEMFVIDHVEPPSPN